MYLHVSMQDEGFVEDVNNLLNTGEIPNLFPAEDLSQTDFRCQTSIMIRHWQSYSYSFSDDL